MITVDQAFELVASRVFRLPSDKVHLRDSLGHVLSSKVVSDIDAPPFAKSMMDGFAIVAGDPSRERTIIERVMAGEAPTKSISVGQATQVMTGAPVPDGATAVVPVEKTIELAGDRVQIEQIDISHGKHIQPQGSLLGKREVVVPAGIQITPHVIAAMAEAGAAEVRVVPRPKVSLLITGNELVDVQATPSAGQIRNSNGPMLTALIDQAHATICQLPGGSDDLEQLTRLVNQGLQADVLVVTGGVSAGVKDLVPQALAAAGVEKVFHKVALKPGKPIWFGVVERLPKPPVLVFGLPGNPVSVLACFHLFVRPALEVLASRREEFRHCWITGKLDQRYSHPPGRESFRPARIDESHSVTWCAWQGSADLAGMVEANCLVRLPAEGAELIPGAAVSVLKIV